MPLQNGVFSIELGTGTVDAAAAFGGISEEVFSGVDRYIEVEVEGELLTPRQRIAAVPYAFQSVVSEQAGHATFAEMAGDSDTVDGQHAASFAQAGQLSAHTLNSSNPHFVTPAQIGAVTPTDISTAVSGHAGDPSAHHPKTSSFGEIGGQISDAQVPTTITRDAELSTEVATLVSSDQNLQSQIDALASPPSVVGAYTGSATVRCTDGSIIGYSLSVSVTSQAGQTLAGTATLVQGAVTQNITVSATLAPSGQFQGGTTTNVFSGGAFVGSSSGVVSGWINGSKFSFVSMGVDLGGACVSSGDATRS